MLRLTATLLCFIPLFVLAQPNLKDIRKKSYEVFVFKINAADAEQYLKKDLTFNWNHDTLESTR